MTSLTEPRTEAVDPIAGPEHVVLAADDSSGTFAAAAWLTERALHHPVTIDIVVAERGLRAGVRDGSPHRNAEGVAWNMREYLAARIPTAPTRIRVLREDLASGLRDAAADADLLVLGCNRGPMWRHLQIATRSTRIAERAPCPTVLVPADWTAAASGPVVAAVATHGADAIVDLAAAEAVSARRPLQLVRGNLLPLSVDLVVPKPDVALLRDVDRRLLISASARARAAHPGLDVRTEFEHRGLVTELVRRGAGATALVVGTASRSVRLSALRGVLEQAPCPIVVVPTGVQL